jgi:hypothetical protein
LDSWPSKPSTFESWVPYLLPHFPDDLVIEEWSFVAKGVHGEIRRLQVSTKTKTSIVCLKLFFDNDAYIRESDAYTLMSHRGVRRCIPRVYYMGEMPRWKWDGLQPDDYERVDRDEVIAGLMIEYFEDCRELNLKTASVNLVVNVARALEKIHEGGVLHRDIAERNILLVRDAGKTRVVWIDFSCAWTGIIYRPGFSLEYNLFRAFLVENMVNFC